MSGMVFCLAGWKSQYTPSWKEVLANGKGVLREEESERSHQQIQRGDAQKPDIRPTCGGRASNGLRLTRNPIVTAVGKSGIT